MVRSHEIRAQCLDLRRRRQHHGKGSHRMGHQLAAKSPDVLIKQPHIQRPIHQPIPDIIAAHGADQQPGLGRPPVKGLQQRRQSVAQQGFRHPDGDFPPALGQVLGKTVHLIDRLQHPLHIGQQLPPRLAEHHPPPHLLKEPGGEGLLQLSHLKGHG